MTEIALEGATAWAAKANGDAKHLKHPLLQALQNTEYGQLTVVTPEGDHLVFSGSQPGPDAHMALYNWAALDEGIARGEVGFADGYIYRRWDSRDLTAMVTFALMNAHVLERFFYGRPWYALWMRFREWLRTNSLSGSRRNIMSHYNLGNEFYSLWLDRSMTYSSALFEGDAHRSLEDAQKAKYQRIIRKLDTAPGDRVLDIGCGWGGFAEEAARAGLSVTGITLSEPQAAYAQERLRHAGLDHLAKIEVKDYRHVTEQFDRIVSIGMFEHVGERYWPTYFNTIHERLKPGGRAMIQSITLNDVLFETLHGCYGFIEYYVFPGGLLPSKTRFRQAAGKAGLTCKEVFSFGQDYAQTLRCWLSRFEENIDAVKRLGCDDVFIRLWRFYLSSCIASFVSKRTDVMQVELMRMAP